MTQRSSRTRTYRRRPEYDIGIAVYQAPESNMTATAKVFTTGRSQAVRIP